MKRIVLMVVLLAAGALALVFLAFQLSGLPSLIAFLASMPPSRVGSGGIGSVSLGASETVVSVVPMLFPSFLLWRACASLAARGDGVMARHRRFHGIALIAVPLCVLAITIVSTVIWSHAVDAFEKEPPETPGIPAGMWTAIVVLMLLRPVFLSLTVMQLFSVVATFKILTRGSQQAS